jgi:hypothetical protein
MQQQMTATEVTGVIPHSADGTVVEADDFRVFRLDRPFTIDGADDRPQSEYLAVLFLELPPILAALSGAPRGASAGQVWLVKEDGELLALGASGMAIGHPYEKVMGDMGFKVQRPSARSETAQA